MLLPARNDRSDSECWFGGGGINPMHHPAELSAPAPLDKANQGNPVKPSSVTGMPAAVLAEIGGGALIAFVGRRPVIIGEAAGERARAVIVQVADRVGQRRGP